MGASGCAREAEVSLEHAQLRAVRRAAAVVARPERGRGAHLEREGAIRGARLHRLELSHHHEQPRRVRIRTAARPARLVDELGATRLEDERRRAADETAKDAPVRGVGVIGGGRRDDGRFGGWRRDGGRRDGGRVGGGRVGGGRRGRGGLVDGPQHGAQREQRAERAAKERASLWREGGDPEKRLAVRDDLLAQRT
jgi:hypothetical protein